jgi:MFS family permease
MSQPAPAADAIQRSRPRGFGVVITTLGVGQIFAWGSSYYLLAVLAQTIADDTGWSLTWIIGGASLGLLAAGVVSPHVGALIGRRGGRPVLATSSAVLAVGLVLLAIAQSLPGYLAAWLVLGVGMGAGLYDPAFATLGRLYGAGARSAITTLTLFGGFASTVCWPLSALLMGHLGWRGACLAYAAFHLAVLLPLYLGALPRESEHVVVAPGNASAGGVLQREATPTSLLLIILLATTITLSAMISTLMSVHLLAVLQSRGVGLAAAVALGALVGPAQVGARAIEFFLAKYHHPIWTKIASTLLVVFGIMMLWAALPIVSLALVLYGAGIGLESVARGTLPLILFDGPRYAVIMGRLAMPSLVAQAMAPSIGAALLGAFGTNGALAAVMAVAATNFTLAVTMLMCLRRNL